MNEFLSDSKTQDTGDDACNPLADFVSKSELAEIFDVSPRTIERWVRLRMLPNPAKLGRTTLHHLPSVRAHLLRTDSQRDLRHRRA